MGDKSDLKSNLAFETADGVLSCITSIESESINTVRERDLRNSQKEFDLPLPLSRDLASAKDLNLIKDEHNSIIHDRFAAMVGSSLVSSSIRRDGKLLVAMVGLPVRGKTFIAKSLKRHFDWIGLKSEIFSVVEYRREKVGVKQPHEFFGETGEYIREKVAEVTLNNAFKALMQGIDIAIYDATNITRQRRGWIIDRVRKHAGLHAHVIFVESICNDEVIIKENIEETKRYSPEYANMPVDESSKELSMRVAHYMEYYEPLDEVEGHPYVKIIDAGRQINTNLMNGYLPGKILMLLMNQHSRPRTIFMSRHGESQFNMAGKIGGNSHLTPAGRSYALKLSEFMKTLYPKGSDLVVWTSTMVRTGETVSFMEDFYDVIKWRALDEINAGDMEGLTYEHVAEHMAAEYQARKDDKLNYRYPGRGESYHDVFIRLEPVMFEMLRCRNPLLIVGHQAILRVLYAYLKRHTPQECPTLAMPLHTIIQLTPHAYSCDEKWHLPLDEKSTLGPKSHENC